MLLSRTQVKDEKGHAVDCRTLRLFDGNPQGRVVELTNHITKDGRPNNAASRYDQIERALTSFGYIFDGARAAYDSTDPLSFNISQLAYTEARLLEKFRVPVIYKDLVPVSYEAPPWADSVQAEEMAGLGKGQIVAANATDMPFADAKFGRRLIEVKGGKIGYKYNVQELIESQQLKRPLNDLRMKFAMIGFERHMQDIALRGDTVHGLYGLWNQPSSKITPVVAPTGNWDSGSTSPLSILADINKGITAVYSNSGTNALVTDIALPMDALSALNNTILSATGSGVTVPVGQSLLAYIKANNMSKLQGNIDVQFHGIVPDKDETTGNTITTTGSSLNYAGALKHSGSALGNGQFASRVVYYAKSEEYLVMHQPLTLTFLAPQPRNDEVVVPGRYRFCPIDVRYPSTIYYQDNVLAGDQQS
jgi:hypothetical protein